MIQPKTLRMRLFADKIAFIRKIKDFLASEDYFFARLVGATAAGCTAILLVALVLLIVTIGNHSQNDVHLQNLEMTGELNLINADLSSVEMLYRNYLLTGKESYLVPFDKRNNSLQGHLDELKTQVFKDPVQRKRVLLLCNRTKRWVESVAQPLFQSRLRNRQTNTATVVASAEEIRAEEHGQSLLNEAHSILDSILQTEQLAQSFKIKEGQVVNQSLTALVFTPRIESCVSGMENAKTDYLLTGDTAYRDLFDRNRADLEETIKHLSAALASSSAQKASLNEISIGVDRWIQEEALPEMAAKKDGKDLDAIVTPYLEKNNMRDVRSAIDEFHRLQVSMSGWTKLFELLKRVMETAGVILLCLLSIFALVASSIYSSRSYRKHLQRIEVAEAETRAVTAETRSIIDTSLDAIFIIDNQGLVQSMNPSGEKMFGYPPDELLGKSISKIIPQRLFLHDMASLGRGTIMAVANHHDQQTFPVEISLNKVEVHGKNHFVASIRDITDRKRSEETLKHIGISVSSHTGGEFLRSLVKQLCKALQTDFAFVVESKKKGDKVINTLIISSKDEIQSESNFEMAGTACEEARKGFRAYSSGVRKEFPGDHILKELDAESFVAMNLRDHEGRSVGIMGVIDRRPMDNIPVAESTLQIFSARAASEIERKRFEDDLAAEKERLAVTLRSIGDGFIATDVEGIVVLMNSVTERLTGLSQARAIGKPLGEVFHIFYERTRVPATDIVREIIKSGSLGDFTNRALIVSEAGTERLIETSVAPIRDKTARKIGVVLAFRDITEKERLEAERRKTEKLESLGVAAGGIAHDFNNLLTSILGNLSLGLMDTNPGDKLATYLTTAKRASLRAQDLAQQLLTFAKGGAPVKKTSSVGQLIEDTVTFSLRGGKIRNMISIPNDLWPVEIDPGQISQVISNLTINAEQAMPSGGTIEVCCENTQLTSPDSAHPGLAPGKYVRITIRDEGSGIPEDYIKKIFDPYFTTKPKGSGLGLATAYSIVTKHGGTISVESKPGIGSTFIIYLPASDKKIASISGEMKSLVSGHGRVLVLDDEEEICALVSNTLTPLGYEVVEAREGSEAVTLYKDALIEGRCFDVVISDLTIPGGMGGKDAIRQLVEIDPEVKAIVSSGYANDPVLSRYKDYGFLACLTKPYEVADLSHIVKAVIESQEVAKLATGDEL